MKNFLILALFMIPSASFAGRQDCIDAAEKNYQNCVANQEEANRDRDQEGRPRDRSNICHNSLVKALKKCDDDHSYSGRGAPDGYNLKNPAIIQDPTNR